MGQLWAYSPARLLWSTSGSWEPWIGNILAGGEKTLYFDGEQTLSTKPALKLTYLENTYLLWIFHFWWRRSNLWQHYRHIFRDHLLRVFHFWDLPDGEGEGQHHLLISSWLVWWMVDWLIDWLIDINMMDCLSKTELCSWYQNSPAGLSVDLQKNTFLHFRCVERKAGKVFVLSPWNILMRKAQLCGLFQNYVNWIEFSKGAIKFMG